MWAILEGQFELLLVNPHHVRAIPGRKTDAKNCEWIVELLQHGLVRGSFVPPAEIQDLRDLTRYRVECGLRHAGSSGEEDRNVWRIWPSDDCGRRFQSCA